MKPPLPPANLATRRLKTLDLAAGTPLHRFYSGAYEPLHFDRGSDGRLNSPTGAYGVLYMALTRQGAFAETFLRQPGRQLIGRDMVAAKAHASIRLRRSIRCGLLTGRGLGAMGATAQVTHGGLPYDVPQLWSAALHSHPMDIDAIAYTARHDDSETCLAIFDRAEAAIEVIGREIDLDATWFWDIADEFDVGLAPG